MRDGALAVVVSGLVGLPAGLVWWLVAPLSPVEKRADGLYRAGGEGDESLIAADVRFGVVTVVAAIAVTIVLYLRTRPARLGPLIGIAIGGVVGAVVAWQTGAFLGPDAVRTTARSVRVGGSFDGPLTVSATGMLLVWPLAAVITYFAATAAAEHSETAPVDDRASEPGLPTPGVSPFDPAPPAAPH